ncbi:hypothetical protein [Actinophytocola sediminis]
MDPLSLSSLGAVGLGYAVKFLFDRASAALDRRAQRRTADAQTPADNSSAESGAGVVTGSSIASSHDASSAHETVDKDVADRDAAENEVIGALRVLEVYRTKNLALEPGDAVLLDTVQRLHAALERLEGVPVDLNAAAKAVIEVDQSADHVRGALTGADLGSSSLDTSAHIRQQVGTLHEGGSVTGFRAGGGR